MVYIKSWAEYQSAAEALYEKAPDRTRYCVKWKASEGKLVLKITDDTTCLKYKTHSSIFLNRFEALNVSLMQKMQNVVRLGSASSPSGTASASASGSGAGAGTKAEESRTSVGVGEQDAPVSGVGVRVGVTSGGVQGGGVKKKKGKKKK